MAKQTAKRKTSKTSTNRKIQKKGAKKTSASQKTKVVSPAKDGAKKKITKKKPASKKTASKVTKKKTTRAAATKKNTRKTGKKTGRNSRVFYSEMVQMLLDKRTELNHRISDKMEEHHSLSAQRNPDAADAAADAQDDELAFLVAEVETRERSQIDEALEKVAADDYGSCERCNRKIPLARLKILPFAPLCVQCQEYVEQFGADYLEDDEFEAEDDE